MIYTKIKYLYRYLGISKSLDSVLHYIMNNNINELPVGRNEINGNTAFMNCNEYYTVPQDQSVWEAHITYGDVHILLNGCEKIGIANTDNLIETERREDDDFRGFSGEVENWVNLSPEYALILFPEDAHMVGVVDSDSIFVRKCCFKFKI